MYHQACNYQLTPYRVQLFVKARMPLRNHVYCCGPGGAMSQTVMIEALGQGIDAGLRSSTMCFAGLSLRGSMAGEFLCCLATSLRRWTWWSGRYGRCPGPPESTLPQGLWQATMRHIAAP